LPRFAGITEADVRRLVASCPKRRFELRGPIGALAGASGTTPRRSTAAPASSSSLSIRATQGHTMSSANTKLDDDSMLTRLDERAAAFVAEAAHGTTLRAWANIKTEGVKRMRRRHVHMARASHEGWSAFMTPNATETARGCSIECNGLADEGSSEAPRTDCVPSGAARGAAAETDGEALGVQRAGDGGGVVISGFRADARVAVWVDVARGVREGVPFFLSANGVVLSPGEGDTGAIPPRLFLRATDLKTGEALAL
jgi:2'-phosphotransferase